MATEIKVPALGESIVEATVGHWLKHEGDPVRAGEALVELETEKVNLEVAADQDGVLAHIARREGETVAIGDVLGTLGTTTDHRPPTTDNRRPTTAGSTMAPASAAVADGQPSVVELPDDTRATPVARRYAAEHGLDVAQIPGSGPGGRVTKEDVVRAAETAAPAPRRRGEPERGATTDDRRPTTESAPTVPSPTVVGGPSSVVAPTERPEERVRMTRRRQTIARRLVEAQQTTAMLTTFNEIDMGPVMELRKRRREWFQQRYGVKLGFMSFFVKATVAALRAFPELNAEIQRDEIVLKKYYDIGIAVGAPGGLVVPVVRDADRQSFAEIEKQIEAYGQKAT
ncbi:MAG: 2-oxo acid dehydrogenase subunit E2, partial [Anaerolineae bacterium]|nr:2-oxo acid dehydrogenase subunit E2 [Anaerolineae bacterium]